ncbi:hypothetical protein [Phenylobacterium sp.]|jgi:hypothetical protein|uniref:hypothetical protein n=1 Tax=Phenylobacterium sp. TaxID=1871053 RepID=UPI00272F3BDA|nr:hypothetical protein [Phenylobacterium sp.]MDP2214754.1 hypothetical protein [Phenylobacterium sp.]
MSRPAPIPTAHYFGCEHGAGHYLFAPRMASAAWNPFEYLDAKLAPKDPAQRQFVAQAWRLYGYSPAGWGGASALSWWDRSVDRRKGSNSIIFAPGLTVTAENLVVLLERFFPTVAARLPHPLEILPGFQELRK